MDRSFQTVSGSYGGRGHRRGEGEKSIGIDPDCSEIRRIVHRWSKTVAFKQIERFLGYLRNQPGSILIRSNGYGEGRRMGRITNGIDHVTMN